MPTNSLLINNDISDLCRVCLQLPEESQYLDLSTIYDEEDNLTYGECFTICTQIDLNAGEGVPHHLCKSCGLELQMCYDFHKKIEESKRVIEQCQRQIIENVTQLENNSAQSENQSLQEEIEEPLAQLIEEKYVIVNDEEQGPEPSHLQQEHLSEFVESTNENDETVEVDILSNESPAQEITHQEDTSYKNDLNIDAVNEDNDGKMEVESHLEIEGYQNLEALEDEETETLQIKYGEKTIPVRVTKLKILESGENEEYVDYTEDYTEEELKVDEREEVEEEYARDINEGEEATQDHLKWQENVVVVANKEHLPIVMGGDEDEIKKDNIYKTSHCKSNENQVIINESSPDEFIEDEENITEEITKTESSSNKVIKTDNNIRVRKRHMGSYSCDYCNRVYPNYSRMKTHRRCHEIDRPTFCCSQCGRVYATKQARDCHIQTAHEKSGYTCSICNKVFAIRKSLEIHVRYHTGDFPYACKLCDKKFAQVCHLNTHINVKHNKIRFSCDFPNCGKYFTSSSSLRNHEYTHGAMPFECEYCQQGYPTKSKLRVHIERKHGIDMTTEQLENMRKFHVMRSKVNLVQFVDT